MHDGGSITSELREYVWQHATNNDELRAIADRIDAEHERACKMERGEGIRIAEEAALDEMGQEYVKLPVDADGVSWHLGDKDKDGRVVTHLNLSNEGWGLGLSTHDYDLSYSSHFPHYCRHYHAPTVEDVLTEFGIDWEHESDCEDRAALLREYRAALLREYAKRLTLAGGDAK